MNNLYDFNLQGLDFSTVNSAKRLSSILDDMNSLAEYKRKKDEALFKTAEASQEQKKLLLQQLEEVREQNKLLKESNLALKENYFTLQELYKMAKNEAERNAKEARQNKIFGWISFAVGTIIAIAGIVVGNIV
jgi:hypothetical protein